MGMEWRRIENESFQAMVHIVGKGKVWREVLPDIKRNVAV